MGVRGKPFDTLQAVPYLDLSLVDVLSKPDLYRSLAFLFLSHLCHLTQQVLGGIAATGRAAGIIPGCATQYQTPETHSQGRDRQQQWAFYKTHENISHHCLLTEDHVPKQSLCLP